MQQIFSYYSSGGIQFEFTGSNFDSVHSPTITINDSRLVPSSIEVSIYCIINQTYFEYYSLATVMVL